MKITIVMPAYNSERTIDEAIRSMLSQTHADWELIICDDASLDGTVNAIRKHHDRRIRLLINDKNIGQGPSRNRAIAAATGQWLTFLDADDAYTPERLGTLLTVARQYPDGIVFDELMECHDTDDGLKPWSVLRDPDMFPGRSNSIREIRVADWIGQKRSVIKPMIATGTIRSAKVIQSDKRCSQDTEFFLGILAHKGTSLWYVPKPMYLYRITPGSMSSRSEHHLLAAKVRREAIALFTHDPAARTALLASAKRFERAATYHSFFSALRGLHFFRASIQACRQPWLLVEFLRRGIASTRYHAHRMLRRGKHRRRQ